MTHILKAAVGLLCYWLGAILVLAVISMLMLGHVTVGVGFVVLTLLLAVGWWLVGTALRD